MKTKLLTLFALAILFINTSFIQKSKKESTPPKTYELNYKGTIYTIKEGDTVYLGYGSNPYGSFMYFTMGSKALPKEVGGKTAIITKIKHYKLGNIDQFMMKTISKPKYLFYTNDLIQCIDKQEIKGINDITFQE